MEAVELVDRLNRCAGKAAPGWVLATSDPDFDISGILVEADGSLTVNGDPTAYSAADAEDVKYWKAPDDKGNGYGDPYVVVRFANGELLFFRKGPCGSDLWSKGVRGNPGSATEVLV